jgi:hypothetical protein
MCGYAYTYGRKSHSVLATMEDRTHPQNDAMQFHLEIIKNVPSVNYHSTLTKVLIIIVHIILCVSTREHYHLDA